MNSIYVYTFIFRDEILILYIHKTINIVMKSFRSNINVSFSSHLVNIIIIRKPNYFLSLITHRSTYRVNRKRTGNWLPGLPGYYMGILITGYYREARSSALQECVACDVRAQAYGESGIMELFENFGLH